MNGDAAETHKTQINLKFLLLLNLWSFLSWCPLSISDVKNTATIIFLALNRDLAPEKGWKHSLFLLSSATMSEEGKDPLLCTTTDTLTWRYSAGLSFKDHVSSWDEDKRKDGSKGFAQ